MEQPGDREHPGLLVAGILNFIVAGTLAFFFWMFTSLPPADTTSATLLTSEWPAAIGQRFLLAAVAGLALAGLFWPINRLLARGGGPTATRLARGFALASGAALPIGVLLGTLQLLFMEAWSR